MVQVLEVVLDVEGFADLIGREALLDSRIVGNGVLEVFDMLSEFGGLPTMAKGFLTLAAFAVASTLAAADKAPLTYTCQGFDEPLNLSFK